MGDATPYGETAAFLREDGDHHSEGGEDEKVRADNPGKNQKEERRPRGGRQTAGWGEAPYARAESAKCGEGSVRLPFHISTTTASITASQNS